jgi:hypothetical protein
MPDHRILETEETKELGRQLLQDGHEVKFKLGGNSMFPYMIDGEVATAFRIPFNQLQLSQVIVFEQNNKWIAHRLVGKEQIQEGLMLITQGDSITRLDSLISEDAYLGVIVGFSCHARHYKVNSWSHRAYGRMMTNLRPFPQFLIRLYLKIRNRLRRL